MPSRKIKNWRPGKRVYVVYNHMPYGNLCVNWFETRVLERKIGDDKTEHITSTAEDQAKEHQKLDYVSLCTEKIENGKPMLVTEKNKMIIITDIDQDDMHPAETALVRAIKLGAHAVPNPKTKNLPKSEIERVANMETRIAVMEDNQNKQTQALIELTHAIKGLVIPRANEKGKD